MEQAELDRKFMDQVLALACRARGETSPNPLVGAVVGSGDRVLGTGFHRRAGLPHAEPQALDLAHENEARELGSTRDWTLYVNLEPCTHQGRTPPCVDAILASPVRRVVIASIDPDPRVAGAGVARLRAAGVVVDVGCRAAEAAELNHVFFTRQLRRRPYVALKVALSADGCIAKVAGETVAITGAEARTHAHGLRAGVDAILIGVTTLERDRPRLDRRLHPGPGSTPRRLVLDPHLRSDPEWLWPGEARPVLFCTQAARERRGSDLERSADLVVLPRRTSGEFDLGALPDALAELGLWSVLVEGGGFTHAAFLAAGLWDRVYVYRNPRLRLAGLEWLAAKPWDAARRGLAPLNAVGLGDDRLEVFVHPQTRAGS